MSNDTSKEEKFLTEARVGFQRLSPQPGDLLTVTFPAEMTTRQVHSVMTHLSTLKGEFGVTVVAVGSGVEMGLLNEEQMNAMGWIKDPNFDRGTLS